VELYYLALQKQDLFPPLSQSQQVSGDLTRKPVGHLSVVFQKAYSQIEDLNIGFAFDNEKIDSIFDLGVTRTLRIVGEQKYSQILIDRLCVHSMFPKRYGGIGSDYFLLLKLEEYEYHYWPGSDLSVVRFLTKVLSNDSSFESTLCKLSKLPIHSLVVFHLGISANALQDLSDKISMQPNAPCIRVLLCLSLFFCFI
jgi:hypothetical protein